MTLTLAPPLWRGFFCEVVTQLENMNTKEIQKETMLYCLIL